MKKTFLFLSILLVISNIFADKKAYTIFNAKGKEVCYKKMIKNLKKADIVMFGEIHDNPIAHWLEYEVTVDLHEERTLILGAEMIEADNQDELNDYLQDNIDYAGLDSTARLWPNHKTDYAPLVYFAKENGLPFIATNIPRRYASLVFRNGFEVLDTLTDEEKSWMAPLPMHFNPELPTYVEILSMMGDHGSPRLVMAQATKDATMAHFILENYVADHLFIHYNGKYHSDMYEGIVYYLQRAKPELKIATITTILQEDVDDLLEENEFVADYIICVDEDMTTTY